MQSTLLPAHRLLLLRHAHSAWPKPGQSDFDRELDAAGEDEARRIADIAAEKTFSPTLILCSPAERCRQTAAHFLAAMTEKPEITYDAALYSEDADHYLSLCRTVAPGETLLIIGHNPMIEETFTHLVGSEAANWHIPSGFPTAALAVFVQSTEAPLRLETLCLP